MIEKKCFNCENMDFCQMYDMLYNMASLLNRNINLSIDNKSGFTNMVDVMAHDCKRFSKIKDDKSS